MRKLSVILICLALILPAALAENAQTMVVDTGLGSMLIAADGTLLTQPGEYDYIYRLTTEDCAPERVLFYATLSGGIAYPYDAAGELEIEDWPEEGGALAEGEAPPDETLPPEDGGEAELEAGDFTDYGYGDIYEYEGGFETNVALMDATGSLLTDFDYVMFTHDAANAVVIAYRADGFASVLDERGNVLLEGEYAAIASDTKGGFFATKPDLAQTDEYGYLADKSRLYHILPDGTEVDTGIVTGTDDLGGFSCGYMCIARYDGLDAAGEFGAEEAASDETEVEDTKFIFIDTDGKDAFGVAFTGANNFSGNYADVSDENYNERLIDLTGAYVTDKAYSWFDFGVAGDGMPIVANLVDGGFDLLSKDDLSVVKSFDLPEGESVFFAYPSGDHLIFAFSDTTMHVLDASGEVLYTGDVSVSAYTFYNACDSQPGRILTMSGEWPEASCQMLDLSGNPVGAAYQEITALSWIGGEGRFQVASYDVAEVTAEGEEGLDTVYDSYRYGVIDQDGNEILEMKYTEMTYLASDRYWVCDGAVYQLVDSDGNVIFEMEAVE